MWLLETMCKSTCSRYFSPSFKEDTTIRSRLHLAYVTRFNPMTMRFVCGWNGKCNWWLSRRSSTARPLRSWVRIPLGAWMFVVCVLSVVRYRSLRRADHSSRGVLPNVMRRCVWSRNLKNVETMARVGAQRHGERNWWLSAGDSTNITVSNTWYWSVWAG